MYLIFSSVVDRLDPDLDPHWEYGSGPRRAKMTHKSEENSSFEVLDVHFGGLGIL
jgi:hypothetical protein